jgi:phosphoglycolate phosphatase
MNYIFDFDGTIADNLRDVVRIVNELDILGGRKLSDKDVKELRKLSSMQALRKVKIPFWRLPRLLRQGLNVFRVHIPNMKTVPGLPAVIRSMYKGGNRLFIVSTNSEENISLFLDSHQLGAYFEKVYSSRNIFGKAAVLSGVLRDKRLLPEETIYIGDETRDITAARRSGLRIASVTWGYNDASILEKYRPDFLIDKPRQLLEIY